MKIAIISNLYPPLVQGGAEIVAQRMVTGLMAQGHEVVVITSRRFSTGNFFRTDKNIEGGIAMYRFYPWNLYHYLDARRIAFLVRILWHMVNLFNIQSAFAIKRILREEKPDVVITHNLMGMGFLIPRAIHGLGMKHVHVLHDVQLYNPSGVIIFASENSSMQGLARLTGYAHVTRWLFNYVDTFIAPSQFLKDFYLERGFFKKQRVVVLPNPVVLPGKIKTTPHHDSLRIVSIGSVSKPKGIQQAVDALRPLLEKYNIQCDIIGDGPALAELRHRLAAETRLFFHGQQPPETMQDFYRSADIVLVPSMLYDASPTVIYEAFSYGVPVIAAASGGAAEIISEGVTGWLFKPGDWQALQQLVINAAKNKESLCRMGEAGRRAVEPLEADSYTTRLLQIIQK